MNDVLEYSAICNPSLPVSVDQLNRLSKANSNFQMSNNLTPA